jgi:putative lipoprotein
VSIATALCTWLAASPAHADDWFGQDKALHFGFSAVIAGGAYAGSALVFDTRPPRVITGASVAIAAGAAKELYDMTGRGDPSWKDFTWDVIGTAVGVGIAFGIDVLVSPRRSDAPAPAMPAAAGPSGVVLRF